MDVRIMIHVLSVSGNKHHFNERLLKSAYLLPMVGMKISLHG